MPPIETHKTADPAWQIAFEAYDPGDEGRREAILALGNGMIVTRATSTDARADDVHYPGTYRAGCYDRISKDIGGQVEETASLVNLPNWLPLTFRIGDGPWFHLDEVDLLDYYHGLDLKTGVAYRQFTFVDAGGRRTHWCENRLTSMANPHLVALRLELTPQNWSGEIEFRSALDGDIINDNVQRYADYERRHLNVVGRGAIAPDQICLKVRTRQSGIDIVQVARTVVDATIRDRAVVTDGAAIANLFHCRAIKGETLGVEKIAAIYTSQDPGVSEPHEAARKSLAAPITFADLRNSHERAWDGLWCRAVIAADNETAALALRFHAFHILQTVSPHTAELDAGVPARGWHGEAYRGHIFWDELFVFPFLNFRFPDLARSLLLYRYRRLDDARTAAREAGFRGAMYPWRSAPDGREVTPQHQKNLLSGHWMQDPTRLQRHIGSAVAFNVWHYYLATGDVAFLGDCGAEMILEIARFWASIAEYTPELDRFEIKGVIGPDEYHNSYPDRASPGLDNNAYTNLMAVWTLCRALEVLDYVPTQRREEIIQRLEIDLDEFALWDTISRKMRIVFHGDGIISQFEGFEKLREFDQQVLPPAFKDKRVDWALEAIGETADAYQVTKQADTLTLFYLLSPYEICSLFGRLGYPYDRDHLLRTADYYLKRTTHRSSLSRIAYAGALAQVDPSRSWNLYQQALKTDLHALKGESIAEGIHLGAMGGTLDILQRRYLGISADADGLRLDPVMPPDFGVVHLGFYYRGNELQVRGSHASFRIGSRPSNKEPVKILHPKGTIMLEPGGEISIEQRPNAGGP